MSGVGGKRMPSHQDALDYIKAVELTFQGEPNTYEDFLELMKYYKDQRIGTACVISRVRNLFRGHPDLILGFNAYLPEGYEITLPLEDDEQPPAQNNPVHPPQKKPVEYQDALHFISKIKTRFQGKAQVYQAFIEVLRRFRKGHLLITEVYREVAELWKDHRDLLEDFARFLPENSATSCAFYASLASEFADSLHITEAP